MAKQQLCTSARAARIFLCCHCPTSTGKCLISRFVEDVNPRQRLSLSSFFSSSCFGMVVLIVIRELKQQRQRRIRSKTSLKSELALLQTLSRLFHLVEFVEWWQFFFYSWILKDCIKVNCTAVLFETSSWYAVVCSFPYEGKITFVAVYHFKVDQGLLVVYLYTCKCTLFQACFDFIAGFSDPSVCQRESW